VTPAKVAVRTILFTIFCGDMLMKKGFWVSLTAAASIWAAGRVHATDIVIYRIGDGSTALVNTGNPVFVDDYSYNATLHTASLVGSVPMPTTASGANKQLIASGVATSEGMLTVSPDGQSIVVTGYARDLGGSGSLSSTAGATVNRTVGIVATATGAVNTSTALTDFADGNNPRSAAYDGTNVWVAGGAGGVRATTVGATTSTQLSTTVTNIRQVNLFASQLYVSDSSGSAVRLGTVGSGTPTTSGQTITNLPGFPTSGSPYQFFFADLSPNVAGVDTLYVADDTTSGLPGGITKFSLDAGSWVNKGTFGTAADAYRGLTGIANGDGSVTLFSTRKGGSAAAGGGELVSLDDSSGYDAFPGAAPTINLLATAANQEAFRGVGVISASIPVPEPASCLLAGFGLIGLAAFARRHSPA